MSFCDSACQIAQPLQTKMTSCVFPQGLKLFKHCAETGLWDFAPLSMSQVELIITYFITFFISFFFFLTMWTALLHASK